MLVMKTLVLKLLIKFKKLTFFFLFLLKNLFKILKKYNVPPEIKFFPGEHGIKQGRRKLYKNFEGIEYSAI